MEGILGVWKEAGMTSFDVVFKLRKILHMKKIGHAGTLDPEVSGVLPICLGTATKMVEFLQDSGKIYTGSVTLGSTTTTEDAQGEVVEELFLTEKQVPVEDVIDEAMRSFLGEITQIPPMYSAVKVNGRRLYEYARAGETVERPQRKAQITEFVRTSPLRYDAEKGTVTFDFRVQCGKGTYVRTLAVDLGAKLGFPSHMSALVRQMAGGITKENCLTLDEIREKMADDTLASHLLPFEFALKDFPRQNISPEIFAKIKNGAVLTNQELNTSEEVLALFYQDQLMSLYHRHPEKKGYYKPLKVFRTELSS
ncbi:tRNA pseudouridine(55) synthase TruB [Enterococcus timonensis]|uniref:tRNA pseudouridine(55) synthase TruB n=1 Tax=Enterococcus timonensis TaxID=1852364 RepID=UPI0008DAA7E2|nr:tRNA pseudouridine(55) synthase TruB [Enterococcus timonensis]